MEYIPSGIANITATFDTLYCDWTNTSLPLSHSFPGTFPENIEDLDLDAWVSSLSYSSTFKNLVYNTLDLLESSPGLSVIQDSIAHWEQKASKILSGTELNKYYEHLALAKYSAYFWSPEEEGGLYGIQYLAASKKKSTMFINWWKVLGCDCVGGLVGGPAGYLGASTISVIMQS